MCHFYIFSDAKTLVTLIIFHHHSEGKREHRKTSILYTNIYYSQYPMKVFRAHECDTIGYNIRKILSKQVYRKE